MQRTPALTEIGIRQAGTQDASVISSILVEASKWADMQGPPMWEPDEVALEQVKPDVHAGLFYLAEVKGRPVGTFKLTN